MKIYSQTNFPSPSDNIFITVTENRFIVWNYSFSDPIGIYLFEYNKTKCEICSKLTIKALDVVLVSILIVNWSDTLFWCFFLFFCYCCWLWMKRYVTTTSNNFQPLPIFGHKELYLRGHIGLNLNIVTFIIQKFKEIFSNSLITYIIFTIINHSSNYNGIIAK